MLQKTETFLSAQALDISNRRYKAIVGALAFLESGKVTHSPNYEHGIVGKGKNFNMSCWYNSTSYECGTVGCIGGWAEWVDARERKVKLEWHSLFPMELFHHSNHNFHAGLNNLFYPTVDLPDDITIPQAIKAIRNYLTMGFPDWKEVVAE
jgi:hypothetical protein